MSLNQMLCQTLGTLWPMLWALIKGSHDFGVNQISYDLLWTMYIWIQNPFASHFFRLCLWNLGSDCNWGQDHRGLVRVQIGCRDDQPDLDIFVEGSLQTNQIDASKQRMQAGPNSWCCEKCKRSSLFHTPTKFAMFFLTQAIHVLLHQIMIEVFFLTQCGNVHFE